MKNIGQFIFEKLKLNSQSKLNTTTQIFDANDPSTWQVGDILCGVWSYTMIVPHFYKILKRTPKSFTIIELKQKLVSGHYNGQYKVIPKTPHASEGTPITARINKRGGVKVGNIYVHKWNGEPLHGDDMD